MKRRIFLKLTALTPFVGLTGLIQQTKAATKSKYTYCANWSDDMGFFDFSPDEVYGFQPLGDKIMVYCCYSVWEINVSQKPWTKKMVSSVGVFKSRLRTEIDLGDEYP